MAEHNTPDIPGGEADSAGESATTPQDAQVATLIQERDAARDQLLRLQAELENYRKRMQRERDEERRYAAMPLLQDLLPGLDNLQRAIDAGRHTDDLSALLQGVEMVAAQIEEVLARHGAKPIAAVGHPFDPHLHEALQQMASADHPPMTVIDEVQRGYTLNDRVIRPSQVIVSSSSSAEATS